MAKLRLQEILDQRVKKYNSTVVTEREKINIDGNKINTDEDLKKLYFSLNDSEKFGIQFGMFPIRLQALNQEQIVKLMDIRMELEKNDINK